MSSNTNLEQAAIKQNIANTLRILSCEMVEKAQSGHPGLPLGFADSITALLYEINFDATKPNWVNRDRIVFSCGHGSALWYSVLYGFGLRSKNNLDNFRQINHNTPGHLEYEKEGGIDLTTGPLGMGFSWAIGMAMAERILNAKYTKKGKNDAINHHTFIICSDGDLMEGVSYEAAALAGQYKLNKIIALWDDNAITIDGPCDISRNENMKMRFEAAQWNFLEVDGHNIHAVQEAIRSAKTSQKPTLIACKTSIGKYSKLENTSKVHGAPLGAANFEALKSAIEWNEDAFLKEFENIKQQASKKSVAWHKKYSSSEFERKIDLQKSDKLAAQLANDYATRKHSENILEHLLQTNENLIIASADLAGSCGTNPASGKRITASDYDGNLLPCGVRENGMMALMGGITMHSQLQGVASTFLVFSDYARPAIRLAALMEIPVILIATHDSIALGEDGPTHQPIEHLDSLRCMPNLTVARPADGFETFYCYEHILQHNHPAVLVLSRQNLPQIHSNFISAENLLIHNKNNQNGYIISSGSETHLALEVAKQLNKAMLSMPIIDETIRQNAKEKLSTITMKNVITEKKEKVEKFINHINKSRSPIHIIESSTSYCWNYFFKQANIFNINQFGASGKQNDLLEHFGYTIKSLADWVKQ